VLPISIVTSEEGNIGKDRCSILADIHLTVVVETLKGISDFDSGVSGCEYSNPKIPSIFKSVTPFARNMVRHLKTNQHHRGFIEVSNIP